MKNKDLQELKTKSIKDLGSKINELEKERIQNQIELKMGKEKNVHKNAKLRKSLAQVLTLKRLKTILETQKEREEQ